MRRDNYKLFSKGKIAGLSLKNRLIRAATYEGGMTEDGKVTPPILDLYRNLADGAIGGDNYRAYDCGLRRQGV